MSASHMEVAAEYSRLKASVKKLKAPAHKAAYLGASAPRFRGTRYEGRMESMLKKEMDAGGAPARSAPMAGAPGVEGEIPAGGIAASAPGAVTLPLLAAPGVDPARTERLVVYDGAVHIVVRDVSHALDGVNAIAVKFGGYMQAMDAKSITVKVPAGRFRECVAEVEELGEVTHKSIKGTDVTEEMRDLRLRLKNAEEVRARLVKLLDKCDKVEEAIKIEKELGRLTEKIELFKGKIRHLEHSVAYSTLTVNVNSPVPQTKKHLMPFEWVRELGEEPLRGAVGRHSRYARHRRWIRVALPEGYIRYHEWPHLLRAMSAENVFVKIERHENRRGGDVAFWYRAARREIAAGKAFAVGEEKEPILPAYPDAKMLVATREIGGKEHGYLLAVVVTGKHVHTFEAWGPADEFEKDREKLGWAVESMRVKR